MALEEVNALNSATPVDEQSPDKLNPAYYVMGETTSFDYSDQPFATLTDDEKKILKELVIVASRTDVASRRFEVEQAWEARLFDRGYQHLLPRRGGGWSLPGEGSQWGPLSTADSSALYATNIYGRDKDIIVGAMARETPRVEFFPQDPTNPTDIRAAEAANKYKDVYEKNNCLREKLADLAGLYYTDGRVILYTRPVADAQSYGYNDDGSPAMREITTIHGKLEGKVPMQVDTLRQMQFVQIYWEIDVATARARYPWVASEIKPSSCGIGEIELDRIARINTRLALLGSYVTGDALSREVTEQFTWLRPEMFNDDCVGEAMRDGLLEKFPHGCLIICAGNTFVGARAESMDDRIRVSHALPGPGQNRRALGTSNISIQKRVNNWFDIMDDFFRKTVPRKHYDAEAFDVAALQQQDNVPGGSGPFLRQPGVAVDQLVFVEPTPQPQPSLPEFTKMFFDEVPASLTGAVPSLYGASTNTDTVGGIAMQRDQALGRIGIAWNAAKIAFAESCRLGVIAAAMRTQTISEALPNGQAVNIDPEVLRGNINCYPEYDQSFPESWRERELRYTEIAEQAAQNPYYASLLQDTTNMRAFADNIRMADLKVPGEDSVKKQLIELDALKTSTPLPNPTYVQSAFQLDQIEAAIEQDAARGLQIPPEAAAMMQQAQQMLAAIPQDVSSIQVAQDDSENHAIEAKVCFDWMNSEEGMKFKNGTAEMQAGFQNVYLHWKEHKAMIKDQSPQEHAPSISFKGEDLPPEAQTQALALSGIKTTPDAMKNAKLINTQHDITKKVVPKTVPENIDVHRITRAPKNDGNKAPNGK